GGPTPPQEEQPNGAWAHYVPHDLKYNSDFEDALMRAVLDPDVKQDGIRVIPSDSIEQPEDGISVRANDISLQSLPSIPEDELPIPLDDPRRIFASPVAGVKLTHPGGYLEGGPGLDPNEDTFTDFFLGNNSDINSADELRMAIQKDVDSQVEVLKERLRARQQAKERNEQIEKELKALMDQHSMELKVQNRIAEENARKKEARERR
ncbi:hypothetical protein EJ03DRAFT_254990, partial [Teratosphaeria nubilosa]